MALAMWGISEPQARIAAQIGYIDGAGTPSRNITRLSVAGIEIGWYERGAVDDLRRAITDSQVSIVFLRTGELPYWDRDTPHALVVVSVEENVVYVNDPAFEKAPVPVPVGDFELAWYEFGCQWATVRRSSQD